MLVAVGLVFCTREKFFYFLALYTIDKGLNGILKLSFHNPRPYMMDPEDFYRRDNNVILITILRS